MRFPRHISRWLLTGGVGLLGLTLLGLDLLATTDRWTQALRGLVALVGLLLIVASAVGVRLQAGYDARTEAIERALRRLAAGELHVHLPTFQRGPLENVSRSVNQIIELVRVNRLEQEPERELDRAMVRESPAGLLVVDVHGAIRRCNPAFRAILSTPEEPVGRKLAEAITVPALREVVEEAMHTRAPAERTAAVGSRELLLRGLPLADGAGCIAIVLDITSVRKAERARRDFLANVSHELRTPITAVLGYAESLADEADRLPPPMPSMVGAIERNARRLHAIIEDVLHLSKLEARGALPLDLQPLLPLIEAVIDRFASSAERKRITLVVAVADDVLARVNASAFEHILANLVDNAIKYSPTGSTIRLRAAPIEGAVELSVQDEGPGIDPTYHERIFERFFRVDEGRSRDVGGTGLGLSLVKHLCNASGAEISVSSALGQGSLFLLRLPVS